jgi:hypothetical protein
MRRRATGPAMIDSRRLPRIALAVGTLISLGSSASQARAAAATVACYEPTVSTQPDRDEGPCSSPDTLAHFPASSTLPALTVSNFGLIMPSATASAGKVEYICDDVYDRSEPARIRRSPNGTVFIPNPTGLITSTNGCTFTRGPANLNGNHILNVAVDQKSPNVVYALGGSPRVLWRSTDEGKTFSVQHTFEADLRLDGLALPGGRTNEIYVFGPARATSSPLWFSNDGGATFTVRDPAKGVTPPLVSGLEFIATDPVRPDVLYFTVIRTEGDEVWRSSDGGLTAARILQLTDNDALAGLAFGATPNDLFVAGKANFFETGRPPGRLYVSHDGGATWAPPIVSGPAGPHYNCLTYDQGQLYACGTNRGRQEDHLLSVSADEGHTWLPVSRLGDVTGPKACVAEACQAVAAWLCNVYSQCTEGMTPTRDASVGSDAADAATNDTRRDTGFAIDDSDDGGCGCRVGAEGKPTGSASALVLLLLLMVARRAVRVRR